MEQIKERFHLYETKESFKIHRKQNLINPDSICFIEETRQIYAQGNYYSPCIKDYEALKELVLSLDTKIKDIIGIEGPSVKDGIINNIADIVKFFDGFTDEDNLKEYIDSAKGFSTKKLSSEEIKGIENPGIGDIVYNTTDNIYVFYNGTEWEGFNSIPWRNA